jgi:hypothetical protein
LLAQPGQIQLAIDTDWPLLARIKVAKQAGMVIF